MWRVSEWWEWVLEEAACEFLYHCVNTIWLFSPVVTDTSDVCCSEEPPPCTEDVGGTWGRCVSQSTSESHSSVCTHNLIQHSTHDTNHVHRVHSLPFTKLPMVDPLSVWSTCCPSLERGCLRWMIMVGHVFTVQLSVVASQWWGTSWTDADLTSVWELQWVVKWYMQCVIRSLRCYCMCLIYSICIQELGTATHSLQYTLHTWSHIHPHRSYMYHTHTHVSHKLANSTPPPTFRSFTFSSFVQVVGCVLYWPCPTQSSGWSYPTNVGSYRWSPSSGQTAGRDIQL